MQAPEVHRLLMELVIQVIPMVQVEVELIGTIILITHKLVAPAQPVTSISLKC